jgi:altronate dehydratase
MEATARTHMPAKGVVMRIVRTGSGSMFGLGRSGITVIVAVPNV